MQQHDIGAAARLVADEFDLPDDEQLRDALASDVRFAVAAYLYRESSLYAHHEDSIDADREARDALARAVREHAHRVISTLEDTAQED